MSNESEIAWIGSLYRSLKWLRFLIVGLYVIVAVVVIFIAMRPLLLQPGGSAKVFLPLLGVASLGVPLNFLLLWIIKKATAARVGFDDSNLVVEKSGAPVRYPFERLTQVYTRFVEEKQGRGSAMSWFPWSKKGETYYLLIARGPGVRIKLRSDTSIPATGLIAAATAANPEIEEPIELA